jgi:hypothetical protein
VYPPVEDLYTRPNLRTNQALELGFLRAARALLARGGVPAVPVRKKRIPGDEDEEDAGMGEEAGEDARAEHIMRFLCDSPEDCTPGKRADGHDGRGRRGPHVGVLPRGRGQRGQVGGPVLSLAAPFVEISCGLMRPTREGSRPDTPVRPPFVDVSRHTNGTRQVHAHRARPQVISTRPRLAVRVLRMKQLAFTWGPNDVFG